MPIWAALFFIAIGLYLLGGVFLYWHFFMRSGRTQMLASVITETGAKIIYLVLGLFSIGVAVAGLLGMFPVR